MMFPLLPGKREALAEFAAALSGPRREEFEAAQISVQRESWFLQTTPAADLLVVHFEADDPMGVFTRLAASEQPFDVWFKEQVREISGVDLTQPVGPLSERVFSWKRE
jgi:hypothetical protein